jgi:hypothetical protein
MYSMAEKASCQLPLLLTAEGGRQIKKSDWQ